MVTWFESKVHLNVRSYEINRQQVWCSHVLSFLLLLLLAHEALQCWAVLLVRQSACCLHVYESQIGSYIFFEKIDRKLHTLSIFRKVDRIHATDPLVTGVPI